MVESFGFCLSLRVHELEIGDPRASSVPIMERGASVSCSVKLPSSFQKVKFCKVKKTRVRIRYDSLFVSLCVSVDPFGDEPDVFALGIDKAGAGVVGRD